MAQADPTLGGIPHDPTRIPSPRAAVRVGDLPYTPRSAPGPPSRASPLAHPGRRRDRREGREDRHRQRPPTAPSRTSLTASSTTPTPIWSPDGRRIAFVSDRDGAANLYVMGATAARSSRLTKEQGRPAPDRAGRRTASASPSSPAPARAEHIAVVDADGRNRQAAHQGGRSPRRQPAWSPDGKKLSYCPVRPRPL